MKTTEIRVRPVIRHAVTRFTADQQGNAASECLGEFGNESYAEEVAEALRAAHKPKQYAIVERGFEVATRVWYAEERAEAEAYRQQLQDHFGSEFRIYDREVTDPVSAARISVTMPGTWRQLDLSSYAKSV